MIWLTSAALGGILWFSAAAASPEITPWTDVRRDVHALLTVADRHVRVTKRVLEPVIAEGVRRSPTFARLIEALNDTDVIVYIQPARDLPKSIDGRIQLVPVVHFQRYLRIYVRTDQPRDALIALIAHELWHALEIATAPDVRDDATLVGLYRRIGIVAGFHAFETRAAQRTGQQVRWELRG